MLAANEIEVDLAFLEMNPLSMGDFEMVMHLKLTLHADHHEEYEINASLKESVLLPEKPIWEKKQTNCIWNGTFRHTFRSSSDLQTEDMEKFLGNKHTTCYTWMRLELIRKNKSRSETFQISRFDTKVSCTSIFKTGKILEVKNSEVDKTIKTKVSMDITFQDSMPVKLIHIPILIIQLLMLMIFKSEGHPNIDVISRLSAISTIYLSFLAYLINFNKFLHAPFFTMIIYFVSGTTGLAIVETFVQSFFTEYNNGLRVGFAIVSVVSIVIPWIVLLYVKKCSKKTK